MIQQQSNDVLTQTERDQIRQQVQNAIREAARGTREGTGQNRVIIQPPGIPFDPNPKIPPQAVDIAIGFFIMCAVVIVGSPLARAFARRVEQRGAVPAVPPHMAEQLQRIEQAVDAMSIEIERISESQRFLARLQSERASLPVDRG